jgi:hypothetical protein
MYPLDDLSYSFRNVRESSSSASRCLNDNTIRQAPHYYKPYFGYLSSCIMSYALHVVLDNDHLYTTPRVV